MMRTVVDPRLVARVPSFQLSRRRAEQRARRWVLRELDRLDEERRTSKDDEG
jgi:IS4 transposase